MELSYNQLKKRDVINIPDGKCFGRITDLTLKFPEGTLMGITVPGKKTNCIFSLFNRSKLYISESNIVRIGGDVILVNVRCGDTCSESVNVGKRQPKPSCSPCPPLCGSSNDNNSQTVTPIDLDDY